MSSMIRGTVSLVVPLIVGLAAETAAVAQVRNAAAVTSCAGLASRSFANTTIASAEVVAAGAFSSPIAGPPGLAADYSKLPSFCRVAGSIKPTADSDIRFEVWLPAESWNGKFLQTGNGGAAGALVHASMADPLSRGYAVAHTDTGHQGGLGDFGWAVGHPEKLIDYQYRAVHELTVVGKAITAAHYGKRPTSRTGTAAPRAAARVSRKPSAIPRTTMRSSPARPRAIGRR